MARIYRICLPALPLVIALLGAVPAWALSSSYDLHNLELFEVQEMDVVSVARSPRPPSKIAENVSVINSQQIQALNAHTLAEVLNTVPGFQLEQVRTPGSFSFYSLQGAAPFHVLVLIDGVPQNDLTENIVDFGLIPVQQIERVEIIKGAASAAWGQALGGVINVVTKSPVNCRRVTGTASASYGAHLTSDLRGEVTGSGERVGYYFSGGNLHSSGLLPNNRINFNNVYGKLVYDLPRGATLTVGGDFRDAFRGLEDVPPPVDFHDTVANRLSYYFLSLNTPLADRLNLQLSSRFLRRDTNLQFGFMTKSDPFQEIDSREVTWGSRAQLTLGDSHENLTAGVEYEHAEVKSREPIQLLAVQNFDRTFERYGLFANGAWSLARLTILPGVRFDHTGVDGDVGSFNLGATYQLLEQTVLRGYWAHGYSLPKAALTDHGLQKVWTTQAGLESSDLPFVWLKGTLFYNKTEDVEALSGTAEVDGQIRKGYEVEARTVPWFDVSLASGYTYTDIRDRSTDAVIEGLPRHLLKLAISYDSIPHGVNGVLSANYVRWSGIEASSGRDGDFLWDVTITKKFGKRNSTPELFFSGHNLFNTRQYLSSFYQNASRWFEGGVRCRF